MNLSVRNIGPQVYAALSATQYIGQTSSNVVIFNSAGLNTGNFYNTATGKFKPLIPGLYVFNATVSLSNNVGGSFLLAGLIEFYINGSLAKRGDQFSAAVAAAVTNLGLSVSMTLRLNGTTDEIDVRALGTSSNAAGVDVAPSFTNFTAAWISP